MTGLGFAVVADQDYISLLSLRTVIAYPIEIFYRITFIFEFLRLNSMKLSFIPVSLHLTSAIRAFIWMFKPFLDAQHAKFMAALQVTLIFDLRKTYGTLVNLYFFHFPCSLYFDWRTEVFIMGLSKGVLLDIEGGGIEGKVGGAVGRGRSTEEILQQFEVIIMTGRVGLCRWLDVGQVERMRLLIIALRVIR